MRTLAICLSMMALQVAVLAEPIPDSIKQVLARSSIGANGELLAPPEHELELYQFVRLTWREFLPRLEKLDLDVREQHRLTLEAIEALPDQDYLEFVTTALHLFGEGKLPAPVGTSLIMPNKSDKEGFLAMNYQDRELAGALRAAAPKFESNPEIQAFIHGILSGDQKVRYVKWMKTQGLDPKPAVSGEEASSVVLWLAAASGILVVIGLFRVWSKRSKVR